MMRALTRKPLIVLLSIAAAFASEKEKPRFSPGAASSYETRQTISGITVAAVPFRSEADTQAAFGKLDPNKYGVLPVLVVIQNDSNRVIALGSLKAELVLPGRDRVEATPAADVKYIQGGDRPKIYAGPVPQVPVHVSRKKNPLAAWEIEGRGFAARMLAPKDSASGFFYFRGLREAATGQDIFYFEVPLDKP
jgi:hypothetical protein